MKQFLLFAGEDYYADGGWNDFHGSFDTVAEAEAVGAKLMADELVAIEWWHVVDTINGQWCAGSEPDKIGRNSRPWPNENGVAPDESGG